MHTPVCGVKEFVCLSVSVTFLTEKVIFWLYRWYMKVSAIPDYIVANGHGWMVTIYRIQTKLDIDE